MSLDQEGEDGLRLGLASSRGVAAAGREPIEELAVAQSGQGARPEDRLQIAPERLESMVTLSPSQVGEPDGI